MYKFAYISYERILTDIRSFLRGSEFGDQQFLDYVKVVDDILTVFVNHTTSTTENSMFNNKLYPITNQ